MLLMWDKGQNEPFQRKLLLFGIHEGIFCHLLIVIHITPEGPNLKETCVCRGEVKAREISRDYGNNLEVISAPGLNQCTLFSELVCC